MRLCTIQSKLFLREPFAVFFTLLFPLLLLTVLGYAFGYYAAGNGYKVTDINVPTMMSLTLATLGLIGLPVVLVEYKEHGILKRYRASPITMGWLMVVLVVVQTIMFLVATVLIIGLTWLLFGIRFSGNVVGVAGIALVAAASLFSVGFALGGLIRTARTAQAVSMSIFFPALFLSGTMLPREKFPHWLARIGDFLPLSYATDGLQRTWIGDALTTQWLALVVLAGMGVVAVIVSWRTFKWF
jgi:ABC-2 type transport system permease protein